MSRLSWLPGLLIILQRCRLTNPCRSYEFSRTKVTKCTGIFLMNCWAFPAACRNPANELVRRLGYEKVNIAGDDIGAEGGNGEHQRPRRFPERRCRQAGTASARPRPPHSVCPRISSSANLGPMKAYFLPFVVP